MLSKMSMYVGVWANYFNFRHLHVWKKLSIIIATNPLTHAVSKDGHLFVLFDYLGCVCFRVLYNIMPKTSYT